MNAEIAPVLAEINAVLKKHDMAGLIMVANQTHTDYLMVIDPSWSCAWIETVDGAGMDLKKEYMVRVRSKLVDYPSKEAQKQQIERTVGTFVTFEHLLTHLRSTVEHILIMIARSVDFSGKSTREE